MHLSLTCTGSNHVALKCSNCTAVGQIDLIAGGFDVSMDDKVERVYDFLTDGYLEFSVKELAAHMAFELSFLPSYTIHRFNAGLPPIKIAELNVSALYTVRHDHCAGPDKRK